MTGFRIPFIRCHQSNVWCREIVWPSKTASRLKGENSPLIDVMEIKGYDALCRINVSF